ncbi:MAG: exodeoxyribonuclease VII large subunit, partial [Pseudomonadota bacterium]
ISRLFDSVNPNRILERGYAKVEARGSGKIVDSAAGATAAGALTLHFRDGAVDAQVGAPLERPRAKTYAKVAPEQQRLL